MDDFCSCFPFTLGAPTSLFRSVPATSHIWVCSNQNTSLAELTISFKSAFRSQLGSIFPSREENSNSNRTSAQSRSFPCKFQGLGKGIWSQHFRAEGPLEPVNLVWQIRKLRLSNLDLPKATQRVRSLATAGALVSWHPVWGVCHHSLGDLWRVINMLQMEPQTPPQGYAPCPWHLWSPRLAQPGCPIPLSSSSAGGCGEQRESQESMFTGNLDDRYRSILKYCISSSAFPSLQKKEIPEIS